MSYIPILSVIINKDERPLYSEDEIRRFKAKLKATNNARRNAGKREVPPALLDEILSYSNSPDEKAKSWAKRGLMAALAMLAGYVVVTNAITQARILHIAAVRAATGAVITGLLRGYINSNVAMITTLTGSQKGALSKWLFKHYADGKKVMAHDIKRMLMNEYGIDGATADAIANDQEAKYLASVNQAVQRARGYGSYMWETMKDNRVRTTHRANQGKVFEWNNPSPITNHPGHDPGCRCWAVPVVSRR